MTQPSFTSSRVAVAIRLSLFYAAFFAALGVAVPFWPLWLKAHGLGPTEIGTVMAISAAVRMFSSPVIANLADKRGESRRPIILLSALGLGAFALFGVIDSFWAILAVTATFFLVWAPVMPMGESLVMHTAETRKLQYGRLRLWGSLTFILASFWVGWLLTDWSEDIIYWTTLGFVGLTFVVCLFLPDAPPTPIDLPRASLRRLLTDKAFLTFMFGGGLIQASHAVYYAFGSLHWRAVGHAEDVIGALWGEGVVVEVLLFALGAAVTRRVSPPMLFALGGAAAVLRWTVTGLTDALPLLVLVQALHAITFGAVHLGSIQYVLRAVPKNLSATAMSLYQGAIVGFTGITMLLAGPIYARFAGGAYLGMAALGGVGLGLAILLFRIWKPLDENS